MRLPATSSRTYTSSVSQPLANTSKTSSACSSDVPEWLPADQRLDLDERQFDRASLSARAPAPRPGAPGGAPARRRARPGPGSRARPPRWACTRSPRAARRRRSGTSGRPGPARRSPHRNRRRRPVPRCPGQRAAPAFPAGWCGGTRGAAGRSRRGRVGPRARPGWIPGPRPSSRATVTGSSARSPVTSAGIASRTKLSSGTGGLTGSGRAGQARRLTTAHPAGARRRQGHFGVGRDGPGLPTVRRERDAAPVEALRRSRRTIRSAPPASSTCRVSATRSRPACRRPRARRPPRSRRRRPARAARPRPPLRRGRGRPRSGRSELSSWSRAGAPAPPPPPPPRPGPPRAGSLQRVKPLGETRPGGCPGRRLGAVMVSARRRTASSAVLTTSGALTPAGSAPGSPQWRPVPPLELAAGAGQLLPAECREPLARVGGGRRRHAIGRGGVAPAAQARGQPADLGGGVARGLGRGQAPERARGDGEREAAEQGRATLSVGRTRGAPGGDDPEPAEVPGLAPSRP